MPELETIVPVAWTTWAEDHPTTRWDEQRGRWLWVRPEHRRTPMSDLYIVEDTVIDDAVNGMEMDVPDTIDAYDASLNRCECDGCLAGREAVEAERLRQRDARAEYQRIRNEEYERERQLWRLEQERLERERLEEEAQNPPEEIVLAANAPRNCRCETCKLRRFGHSKLKSGFVESHYSIPPGGWNPQRLQNDPFAYYLGVELETDLPSDAQAYNERTGRYERTDGALDYDLAADMARPKYLWWPKSDSSVQGPEFASQPATLAFWHSRRRQLGEMFRMLIHAGYRSHDGGSAGMHVNISRCAFDDGDHLFRFLTLLHSDTRWALKMSQRTSYTMNQWAKLDTFAQSHKRRELCDYVNLGSGPRLVNEYGETEDDYEIEDRYVALNVPYNTDRFEFRLPRGTLRLDRFYKNLEWTAGMIEFTRNNRLALSKPQPFMEWALTTTDIKVPHLAAFIKEKELLA